MLAELKFVAGAVAAKDLVPGLTHFRIQNGTVRSYNGNLAMCSPIALDIDCCPKGVDMVRAIANCEDATVVSVTPSGKLSIRSGGFRALVPLIEGDTPHVEPAGQIVHFNGEQLLKAFKVLDPIVGTDASRPFTTGVLIDGASAYATNNVVMAQYWIGDPFPGTVNIPRSAVRELLRIGEAPTHAQVDSNSITFHFTDGRWIRSQLIMDAWPLQKVNQLLDQPNNPQPIDPTMFVGLAKLKSMTDGKGTRVYLKDSALRTSLDEDEGSVYELPGLPFEGCYNMQMLGLLEDVVTSIDMTLYPDPCIFYGENLRGAIVGMSM
jgi:hypothetical protein